LLMFLYFLYDLQGCRKWGYREWTFVVSSLLFIVIIAGFLGLSAPNYGTLARYRCVILPVWVVLCCRNLPFEQLKTRFTALYSQSS
ncbi:MAG: hypothetical protein P8X57_10755, partial [Cyclobacteriaceae bacterium]